MRIAAYLFVTDSTLDNSLKFNNALIVSNVVNNVCIKHELHNRKKE